MADEIITSQELLEHVRTLADDLDVYVWICVTCPGDFGTAVLARDDIRTIMLTELPDSTTMYLIALHELGHHAEGWSKLKLDREAYAWRWAIEQSLIPLGQKEWARIESALSSYADDRRYKHTPAFTELWKEAEAHARPEGDIARAA